MKRHLRHIMLQWLERVRLWQLHVRYQLWGIEIVNEALLRSTIGVPAILRKFGGTVGAGVVIHGPLLIHNAKRDYRHLHIGNGVHMGRGILLDLSCPLTIADNAVISMRCTLLTHQDVGDRPQQAQVAPVYQPLTVGANAYLGSGVTVLAGAHIGAGATVGAGAVVTKAVAAQEVVGGVPARSLQKSRVE
jgi:acetyltransferase-like isoleucine patch superfamily enzyme